MDKSAQDRCNSCRFWQNGYCTYHECNTSSQYSCDDYEED